MHTLNFTGDATRKNETMVISTPTFRYPANVSTTLGLSYDSYKGESGFQVNKFNPKFGLQWDITANLRLRLAWFESVKSDGYCKSVP